MRLSALERKILNCIQEEIPLTCEPFKILAKKLGLKEDELLRKIKNLKDKGIIHSFACHLNHKRLGFESSLIALRVSLNKITSITEEIIKYPEVTHCYLREGEYNLWVVFIYQKKETFKDFLNKLEKKMGRENILNLPTRRQFKLKTNLPVI